VNALECEQIRLEFEECLREIKNLKQRLEKENIYPLARRRSGAWPGKPKS
jgi:hypothetical protein